MPVGGPGSKKIRPGISRAIPGEDNKRIEKAKERTVEKRRQNAFKSAEKNKNLSST